MKKLALLVLAGMLLFSTSAFADVYTYDFNDGMQGWNLWATDPMSPDGALGKAFLDSSLGGVRISTGKTWDDGKLHIGGAYLDLNAAGIGSLTSFIYTVDVSFAGGKGMAWSGIGYRHEASTWIDPTWDYPTSDLVYCGENNNGRLMAKEWSPWGTKDMSKGYTTPCPIETNNASTEWKTITLQIQYNWNNSGYMETLYKLPSESSFTHFGDPAYVSNAPVNRNEDDSVAAISHLFFTQRSDKGDIWSNMLYDNAVLQTATAVPEPGSMLALGTGLVGLLGVIRRRK